MQLIQVLFLELNTSLVAALDIVKLTNLVRNPGLALGLFCALSHLQTTLIWLQGWVYIKFQYLLGLLYVNLDQFLPYQLCHLNSFSLILQNTSHIKSILQKINGLIFFRCLVITFSQSQQSNQFILLVLARDCQLDHSLVKISSRTKIALILIVESDRIVLIHSQLFLLFCGLGPDFGLGQCLRKIC